MQCSISAQNPNSSWLDRLRSSRGFPISSDLENLDQFLSSNPNPNPNPIPKPPPKPPTTNKDPNFYNLMTNVLSDLFIMGNPPGPHHQKNPRKQPNPRICNGVGENREVSPSSVNNIVAVEGKKRKLKVKKKRESEGPKDSELVGFSRTEVTVIDTSLSPEWKVARVLYRKGLFWKVREKKMVRIGRKRRRKSAGSEKERKVVELERRGLALLNKESTQTDKKEDSKESGNQILIPRRPKFARSPRHPAAKSSNVLRLARKMKQPAQKVFLNENVDSSKNALFS